MEPTFALEDDGVHFSFEHDCYAEFLNEQGATQRIPFRSKGVLPNGFDAGTWHVVAVDPLTVQPSIHCLGCGTHGFIIDGNWRSV